MARIGAPLALALTGFAVLAGCGGGDRYRLPSTTAYNAQSTTSAQISTTTTTSAAFTAAPAASPTPTGTNATTSARATPPVTSASAVLRLSTTRCDRAAACGDVGTNRSFGDRDECMNEVGHDVVALLPEEACAGGVDAKALASCISELEATACGDPQAAPIEKNASCARERLCASSP